MKTNTESLPSNEEVLSFIKSNLDKLPVSYLLLTPHKAEEYSARMSLNNRGEVRGNQGVFYKPTSSLLNEKE